MDKEKYSFGGRFKTTIGKTNYEVVVKFRNEGMTMQDRALRAVNESVNAEGKRCICNGIFCFGFNFDNGNRLRTYSDD